MILLTHNHSKISCSVKDAQDFYSFLNWPIEDQIVFESRNLPYPNPR